MRKDFNATLARVAGNLLSGAASDWFMGGDGREDAVRRAVETARAIIAEIERTEPESATRTPGDQS